MASPREQVPLRPSFLLAPDVRLYQRPMTEAPDRNVPFPPVSSKTPPISLFPPSFFFLFFADREQELPPLLVGS